MTAFCNLKKGMCQAGGLQWSKGARTDKAGLPARRLPAPPEPVTGARGYALKKRESRKPG